MDLHNIFPLLHSWLLVLSILLMLIALSLSTKEKYELAMTFLFLAAIFIRLFMAHLDPFLHDWDERFHALVARNMMQHPFTPMLRVADWVPYDYRDWGANHIWLHKPPLFMWQMALSMKLFGVSEFAIRYPGVLMGSIGILMIYRICVLMTGERHIAFLAALLTCFSYYPLELLSGNFGMDQNDTAFSFYVLASMWGYAEYFGKKTLRYALLSGFFAGCAVLVKWLPGLLVFSGWGVILISSYKKPSFRSELKHYFAALLTSLIVFVPWQIYIFQRFPAEAGYEIKCYVDRLHREVGGDKGDWLYYINQFDVYYGSFLSFLLPVGIALFIFHKKYRNKLATAMIICFLAALVFYSFISITKVPGYFMLAQPIGYVFIATAACMIISIKNVRKYMYLPAAVIMFFVAFDLPEITRQHDPFHWEDWKIRAANEQVYINLRKYLPERVKIVVNAKDWLNIMFYNNDIDAYGWIGDEYQIVKKQHLPVGIMRSAEHGIYGHLVPYDSAFIVPPVIQ